MKTFPMNFSFGITRYVNDKDKEKSILRFSPKMSMQRYITVLRVIKDYAERSVVETLTEFGCGSFVFFYNYLFEHCDFLKTINQIDLNYDRMLSAIHIFPWVYQKRRNINNRNPLNVNVFTGNIAHHDRRMLNTDIVVCIELIEHLTSDEFELFPSSLFNFIQPKLVIITTPNYDFNILFEDKKKFRHPDHKFEFTAIQFQKWASDTVSKYPNYGVEFYGIGSAPQNINCTDYCTQMAVFTKKFNNENFEAETSLENYTLVETFKYFTSNSDSYY